MEMTIELPHDWGAIKRPTHHSTSVGVSLSSSAVVTVEEGKIKSKSSDEGGGGGNDTQGIPPKKKKSMLPFKTPLPSCSGEKKETIHQVEHDPPTSTAVNTTVSTEDGEETSGNIKRKQPTSSSSEQVQPKVKVANSLLGPRSVFNAITHDTPEKGQLKQMVIAQLSKHTPSSSSLESSASSREMDVHCLLSKLPYQKMLSDLFINHDKEVLPSPHIPYVTRAYEESFMREPLHSSERLCAKNEQCECMFIDPENPFVCIEFLLPGEKQPSTPHLCVVCCRAVTQQLYYDIMFDKHDFGGVIQRFGNIHSQPDEYALDAMLIAAPNVALHIMPLPIVSHQRNRYTVFTKRGIKHLKQSRVYFQCTPSC